jgi:hypothetical protein
LQVGLVVRATGQLVSFELGRSEHTRSASMDSLESVSLPDERKVLRSIWVRCEVSEVCSREKISGLVSCE